MKRIILCLGVVIVIGMMLPRILGFKDCLIAQYDLKRDTSYSFISGKCMAHNEAGKRIYLNQLRGMEGTDSN